MKKTIIGIFALSFLAVSGVGVASAKNAEGLYKSKCKMCHSFDKKKVGPSFSSMSSDSEFLIERISNGRKMMPKFKSKFTEDEIKSLVVFIKSKQEKQEKQEKQ